MADDKKYYWIKLKEDFFDLSTIDWLMSQQNGCEYVVLYQKLCLLTANKDGAMFAKVGEMLIPYDAAKIARDTKFDFDTVVVALELFKKIGLIYEQQDGILHIPYVKELVGSETSTAKRMRKHRAKNKVSQCDNNVTHNVTTMLHKSIEYRDKSIEYRDKILDIDAAVKALPDYRDDCDRIETFKGHVMLSDNQTADLLDKMGIEAFDEYVIRLDEFIKAKNANVKSHYQTILKWYNEDRVVNVGIAEG